MGYKLSEKGLMNLKTKKFKSLKSEEDIFKILKLNYIEPKYRY